MSCCGYQVRVPVHAAKPCIDYRMKLMTVRWRYAQTVWIKCTHAASPRVPVTTDHVHELHIPVDSIMV